METISLQGKTNFVEKRVGEYSKSGVGIDQADQLFSLDASFWDEWNDENVQLNIIS
jgi:ribonucleoside-diphosphate reductase subunit M2